MASNKLYKVKRNLKSVSNVFNNRFIYHSPVCLTHVVTYFCNLKCEKCNAWILQKDKDIKNELTTSEVFEALDKAESAGIISYTIWGGEPLLRKDIGEILHYAYSKKFFTSLITNGYLLKEHYKEINDYVDFLIVSIDGVGKVHDESTQKENSYKRIIEGLNLINNNIHLVINCVITNKNYTHLNDLINIAKQYNAKITFEPVQKFTNYNEHLLLNDYQLKETFNFLLKVKKTNRFIANSKDYFRNFAIKKEYICHAPKVFTTLKPNGEIYSCMGNSWGNIKDVNFREVFNSDAYREFCRSSESCNRCSVSCVIETSEAYSMKPKFFYDKFISLLRNN